MSTNAEIAMRKLPPQNIEAEQMVLGAVLLDNLVLDEISGHLIPEDFYRDAHREIFSAMLSMHGDRTAIDLITLTDKLRGSGAIEKIGGASYLSTLVALVPTGANAKYHAKIVRDKAVFRRTIRAANDIIEKAYAEPQELSADEHLDRAEQSIFEISQRKGGAASFIPMRVSVQDSWKKIESLYETKGALTGVASGFPDLDALTSGFQPGDLIIIAGRPSMGKTAFGMNIVEHAAVDLGKSAAVFSLEMSHEQLTMRLQASMGRIDLLNIRTGNISDPEWGRLGMTAGKLSESKIYIDDIGMLSVNEIRARSRRLKAQNGLDLIVVDYLQLMRGIGGEKNREQEIAGISRSLKALAKELCVPVIALSQLNRALESRGIKRPTLADLRESGAIEQDADLILFMYREEVYNKCTCPGECICERRGAAEVILAKQRQGPTGDVPLVFLKKYARFESAERRVV